jgi:hypothetical protein
MKINNNPVKINIPKTMTAISGEKVEPLVKVQKISDNEHLNEFYSPNKPGKKPQKPEKTKILPGEKGYLLDKYV